MTDPDNITVDVEEMRAWLVGYKEESGQSWGELSRASGIPHGTLSPWVSNDYRGNAETVAKRVFRFRQLVQKQAEHTAGLQEAPDFVETETANRIRTLLIMAHRGRITVGATGPGTGKTLTARQYANSVSNVWIATMEPATKTLAAMIAKVQRAIGGSGPRGWVAQMSDNVISAVRAKRGLLVIDEANHLTFPALEQLRAWHDETGVGVCLLGNEELHQRIRGAGASHAFARLDSRIAASHVQDLPTTHDIEDFLDAWKITDPGHRRMLTTIGSTAGYGGLREIAMIVDNALILARDEARPLSLADLKDAQSMRSSRSIRTAG